MKRRDLLKGSLGLAAVPALSRLPASTRAAAVLSAPAWVFYGPDPQASMVVNWSSGSSKLVTAVPAAPQIRYGLTAAYGATAVGTAALVPLPTGYAGPAQDTWYCTALLAGLAPGNSYHYSVSDTGKTWTADATFTTAPAAVPLRFTAFGDQAASSSAVSMTQLAASLSPAFHLIAGDLAYATPDPLIAPDYTGYSPAQWDTYLKAVAPVAGSLPWQASIGAHEIEPLPRPGYAGFTTRFPYPVAAGSGSPVVRSLTCADVAIIHLDGNDLSAQEYDNNGYTGGTQTAWLEAQLTAFRAAGSGIDFIVVVLNCCCYSSNTQHGSDGGVRNVWAPLFDAYNVDLVISGHVHAYERTNPMIAGQPTMAAPSGSVVSPPADGTTYICAGGGGNGLYKGWYGTTLGGDPATTAAAPKVWQWSGGDSGAGGSGKSEQVTDTAAGYSAFRRAAWHCLCINVSVSDGQATMAVQALEPAQTATGVTSITSPVVMDSVTITRPSAG